MSAGSISSTSGSPGGPPTAEAISEFEKGSSGGCPCSCGLLTVLTLFHLQGVDLSQGVAPSCEQDLALIFSLKNEDQLQSTHFENRQEGGDDPSPGALADEQRSKADLSLAPETLGHRMDGIGDTDSIAGDLMLDLGSGV